MQIWLNAVKIDYKFQKDPKLPQLTAKSNLFYLIIIFFGFAAKTP